MDGRGDGGRRPYARLTAGERARFLEVLAQTGNRRVAAAAIGVEPRLMDQRRAHDPDLDRDWAAAVETAHRRLSGADGPFARDTAFASARDGAFDGAPADGLIMVRRGKKGRLQMVAVGEDRWSAAVEERFKAALRATGNIRAAARAVGFSEGTIWQRRRKWPAFARMLEEMLEEAEMALEFRIASMGSNIVAGEGEGDTECASGAPAHEQAALSPGQGGECPGDIRTCSSSLRGSGVEGAAAPMPFDADFAMRFLKWREEKRRGRGRWAPRAKPPSIEEVTEKIVRRVEAIKRHRQREAEE